MRKFVSILFTAALMFSVAGTAVAELNMEAKSFYGHGMIALPSGTLGDFAGTGLGAGAGMNVPYSELLNFRAEIGYIIFGGKDYDNGLYTEEWSWSMIPVTVLGQYKMKVEDPFYMLGGLGLTFNKFNWEYDYSYEIMGTPFSGSGSFDDSSSDITLVLGGGYEVNEQVSIEGRFHIISDSNYLSVHGTYAF